MTNFSRHPGRSPEFLSRLHDGDLSAAERVQFESHRAHCTACRAAAAEFEAALALYRSNRPRPPASDLSARVLRRLQSSPRRAPFGVTFGIDMRWAAAFAVALLATIVGSSVVVRKEAAERKLARQSAPIPVALQPDRHGNAQSRNGVPPAPPPAISGRPAATASRTGPSSSPLIGGSGRPSSMPAAPPRPLEKDAADSLRPEPSGFAWEPESNRRAAGSVSSAQAAAPAAASQTSLEIRALDDAGAAPALIGGDPADLAEELRGREFVLVVEANGRVAQVNPAGAAGDRALDQRESRSSSETAAGVKAQELLKELRFQSSDRTRLLGVRVK